MTCKGSINTVWLVRKKLCICLQTQWTMQMFACSPVYFELKSSFGIVFFFILLVWLFVSYSVLFCRIIFWKCQNSAHLYSASFLSQNQMLIHRQTWTAFNVSDRKNVSSFGFWLECSYNSGLLASPNSEYCSTHCHVRFCELLSVWGNPNFFGYTLLRYMTVSTRSKTKTYTIRFSRALGSLVGFYL